MIRLLKETVNKLTFLRSMFSRLIASFILIIIIISSFNIVASLIYNNNMEKEITDNVKTNFYFVANQYESYFNQIQEKVLMDFYLKHSPDIKIPQTYSYEVELMVKDIHSYAAQYKFISDFIVLVKDYNYVITMSGTITKKLFFEKHYVNDQYSKDFWMNEFTKGYVTRVYPVTKYTTKDGFGGAEYKYLVPVVKYISASNSLLIVLVDINKLKNTVDPDLRSSFYIFDDNKELLYSTEEKPNKDIIKEILGKMSLPSYWEFRNGYIFTYKPEDSSFTYCKFYPNSVVKKQLYDTNRVLTLVILLSVCISVVLSVFIVKRFNNPVKQIYNLVKQSRDKQETGKEFINLNSIKEDIAGIINKNTNYIKDLHKKNSLLNSYFYQVKLKNIILSDDSTDENTFESGNYTVLLFKIHFRDDFYNKISPEINKGSYILKDMINIYVHESFSRAVTFQIENDQVVSIANVDTNIDAFEKNIKDIMRKLESEDEYVYFTVAYSKIINDVSELHEVYKNVTELLRYRKLITRTQLLSESSISKNPERLYFTEDQQKQFSNLLRSVKRDECIRLIDKTFEYNVKNEINEFSMYLLFVQVIDCCSNVLLQLYNDIPSNLPLINDYLFVGRFESVDDYKKRYTSIINECMDYIEKNQKQTDYIVDFVKGYINDNYASDITLEMLADKLKITHTYLSRYFKNTTGINLSDYLHIYRMKKACMLLQNSYIPIKEIAPKVGINNISTFMRSFKSYVGKSPSDFRKSLLN